MDERPLYSIGHGTRPLELFIALLREFQVVYLIDVAPDPSPVSARNTTGGPWSQGLSENWCAIRFHGRYLRRETNGPRCYTAEGKGGLCGDAEEGLFQTGMERLITAHRNSVPVAIMCSESKPGECHRTRLIGQALAEVKVPVMHID
ncbi:MAG: hypothetical protein IPO87_15235 [Flavobacteriales bacterium]|nr:hypothetical protein [Flavobacteriales bacterium]